MKRHIIIALAVVIWAACCVAILWAFAGEIIDACEAYCPSDFYGGPNGPISASEGDPCPVPTVTYEAVATSEPTPAVQPSKVGPSGDSELDIQPPDCETEPVRVMQGEFTVTAYCACKKCCGYWATVRPLDENGEPIVYTASGTVAKRGRTIAVDPEVFEYGTEVWFDGPWGEQAFIAEDCGRGVEGRHIDIYFDDHEEARQWGLQTREVWLYIKEDNHG